MPSIVRAARPARARLGFTVVSGLAAQPDVVWRHAVSPAGVNHELGPVLHMGFPAGVTDLSTTGVPLGTPLGRSHLRLFGLLPVEWDDVTFVDLEPGRRFLECSRLRTQRRWRHERVVTPDGTGSRVTDRLAFEPRLASFGPLHWGTFRAVFAWRHHRLGRRFGRRPLTFEIETERLRIRPWRAHDGPRLAEFGRDPRVVRFIGNGQTWDAGRVRRFLSRQGRSLARLGFALGAVEERASGAIVGLCGLQPSADTDEVEAGWWLAPDRWGRGYASEAGRAVLRFGFEVAGLQRIMARMQAGNTASMRVAERLGMRLLEAGPGMPPDSAGEVRYLAEAPSEGASNALRPGL